jgi:tryptophanyl-tRNA synthetase
MTTRLTGFKPTGRLHLGNYIGAIRPIVSAQRRDDSAGRNAAAPGSDTVAFVADLHALTAAHDPSRLRELTIENAATLLAAGVDPAAATFYLQSDLTEHSELHYLLECATGYGEAQRMIQFKEKAKTERHIRLSLLTYPVLMASDILLHDTDEVPVGEDQSQHVELTRDVAIRFNTRYGQTFTVPRAVNPPVAARIMDLAAPRTKMGKSNGSHAGTLFLLDPPDVLRRKVMRAVTDAEAEIRHAPETRPGVSNLLEILAACDGGTSQTHFPGYGQLKAAVADAVIETVRPIQRAHAELTPDDVRAALRTGAEKARGRAAATVRRARRAIGLN